MTVDRPIPDEVRPEDELEVRAAVRALTEPLPPRILARSVSLDPREGYSLSDPKRNGPGGRW